ncbi:phosphatase PAP2 family protein [Stenotrophomonas sp. SY1]|uniref:acid phosphatase n=1 Tax=Stenotrophomonas sp. SY1 TaxID=477235 RepID=UPI001E3B96CD|nr:phosphatase PAP2 family protein [Stenotrophomonas sp. SY1]MCD9085322.1 phosphatase PAP2 family protein [Stenotrophomonas sp. SY1]
MKRTQLPSACTCSGLALLLAAVLTGGCSTAPLTADAPAPAKVPTTPAPVPELRPGVPAGYLGHDLPDSLALLPPPPARGSAGFAQDQAVHRAAQRLRSTLRYALASADADLHFPHVANTFSCALGVPISQQQSPHLYLLLQRTLVDAGLATYGAKNHYKRTRPFVFYKERTCAPADEAELRGDGSYPSGHTAIGWTWALLLTELSPGQADALLARGRAFGENRLICNAHWQSDVLEGRAVAAGALAKLHANADFNRDMALARTEIDILRGSGAEANGCDAEKEALAIPIPGVQ